MNPVRPIEQENAKRSNGVKRLLIALQFLTILPVRIKAEIKDEDYGRSLLYFPLVGLLIGIILSIAAALFASLPNLLMAALILIASIIITGGIHLDGLADTCDGLYGKRSREEILRIMRDSRIGVMGVIGVVSILLLKFALIANIPQDALWRSLVMMAIFARWSQAYSCYTSSYARKDGKAKFFIEDAHKGEVLLGGIFTLSIFLLLIGIKGVILFFVSIVLISLFISYIKRKIGGMTGDTIGAVSEIAELLILLLCLFGQK